jgi:hypothetical protein
MLLIAMSTWTRMAGISIDGHLGSALAELALSQEWAVVLGLTSDAWNVI